MCGYLLGGEIRLGHTQVQNFASLHIVYVTDGRQTGERLLNLRDQMHYSLLSFNMRILLFL